MKECFYDGEAKVSTSASQADSGDRIPLAVFEIVRSMLSLQSDIEESKITADSELRGDLGLDSLDVVDLSIEIEDIFNFPVTESAYYEFCESSTVGDVVSFIEKQNIQRF